MRKNTALKLYHWQCLESENGTSTIGNYFGSLVTSNKISGICQINDVIAEAGIENVPMDIHVYEENIEALYDAYVAFIKSLLVADPTL